MFAPITILVFLSCAVAGTGFQQKLIFDGMSLPVDWNFTAKFFPNLTFAAASVTTQFNIAYIPLSVATIGKNKTDPTTNMLYSKYQEGYIKTAILTPFPEGYLHFGDGDDFANLPHLLKNNVFFMASVISASNKTFKIDPFGKRGQTYFSQFIANLKFTVPRVSATFDSEMNVINMRVYSSLNPNTELTGYSLQKKAVLLIYQCSYYAQNIHASVHAYHYIMSSAMVFATNNTSLYSWSKPYMYQQFLKYSQLITIVLGPVGFLTGTPPFSAGYSATNRTQILALNKKMICEWGTYKTADEFVKRFILGNIKPCSYGVLGEMYMKQAALIPGFASAMVKEFKKDPKYKSINANLKSYLMQVGEGVSSIANMKSWLAMMTVTGIMHGSTYSMTRYTMTHTFVGVNSPESLAFTPRDANMMQIAAGTVLGTNEDFHAFSDTLPSTNPYNINRVLKSYDSKTAALKDAYQEVITKDPAFYNKFGWILSDQGPNWIDGKQLSLISYF